MLKRTLVVGVVIIVASITLLAKPKEKEFNNTPQQVFEAALRTARERHVVTNVDEKNLMLTFESGVSALSYGFVANASVEQETGGKCKLIINVQHKNQGKNASWSFGAGDRMADKFFQQVQEELARNPSQSVATKPEAQHVEAPANAQPTSPSDTSNYGKVSVAAVPDGADVSVDGSFVGNAPATLKLMPGKHTITVSQQGFKTWSRELSVLAGSEVSLKASLEKQ